MQRSYRIPTIIVLLVLAVLPCRGGLAEPRRAALAEGAPRSHRPLALTFPARPLPHRPSPAAAAAAAGAAAIMQRYLYLPLVRTTGYPIIMAAGDIACGADSTGAKCEQAATAALLSRAQVVLALGDVQYECGEVADFAAFYDPTWGRYKAKTRPAVGNHEYNTSTDPTDKCFGNPAGAKAYFTYFGTAAGDPTKGYYSYNVGAWHLIALNSNCSQVGGCGAGSAQEQWLRADLAAHPQKCTLAYMHHPRFSSGQMGDSPQVQPLWQALYEFNADLVLAGHDHMYERFAPQTPGGTLDRARGIRQFVVGTGGRNLSSMRTAKPNSEVRNDQTFGVLQLTLRPSTYAWQFRPIAGSTSGFTDAGSGQCH